MIAEDFGAGEAKALLAEHPDAVLWLDLLDPDLDGLAQVQRDFALHPLAVEDAVHDHQRPKLDRYPGHLFLNVYAIRTLPGPDLRKTEISAFVMERVLITVHKSEGDVEQLIRRWDADDGLAAKSGVSFLVYGLLDVVVDGQYAAARGMDEAMDGTEDVILQEGGAPRDARRYGFGLRHTLALMRRVVNPMPALLTDLLREDTALVEEHMTPYFRDVDDHARRAAETIDMARDRISGLLEADLNEQSTQLNEVTRKLAAWAAIIAVPTALTGYFGQNLPYPGYEKWWGFLVSTAAIVVSAGALYWYLKRRGWL